jgi:type II secretory pathway component PulL
LLRTGLIFCVRCPACRKKENIQVLALASVGFKQPSLINQRWAVEEIMDASDSQQVKQYREYFIFSKKFFDFRSYCACIFFSFYDRTKQFIP